MSREVSKVADSSRSPAFQYVPSHANYSFLGRDDSRYTSYRGLCDCPKRLLELKIEVKKKSSAFVSYRSQTFQISLTSSSLLLVQQRFMHCCCNRRYNGHASSALASPWMASIGFDRLKMRMILCSKLGRLVQILMLMWQARRTEE
jgi:hypothetical protein